MVFCGGRGESGRWLSLGFWEEIGYLGDRVWMYGDTFVVKVCKEFTFFLLYLFREN